MNNQILIETLEDEIKTKKTLLKLAKAAELQKKQKMFHETKLGKFYYQTVTVLTKPFADMFNHADGMLNDPAGTCFDSYEVAASRVQELIESDDFQSLASFEKNRLLNKLAYYSLKLKILTEKYPALLKDEKTNSVINRLDSTINNNRPLPPLTMNLNEVSLEECNAI